MIRSISRGAGGWLWVHQAVRLSTHIWMLAVAGVLAGLCAVPAAAGTLTDLGYANGLVLHGPGASQTVYFPLPADAQGATLYLRFSASAALDGHSNVTISADGVPLQTIMDSSTALVAAVTIPPRFTTGEFLQLSFTADQTIDDVDTCYDNDGPSNWTDIAPDTDLEAYSVARQGVGAVWRGLGTPLTIALPAAPRLTDIETALVLSTALVERGIAPFFSGNAHTAQIVIDPQAALQTAASVDAGAQIFVPSAAAARALVAGDAALRMAAASAATGTFTPAGAITGDQVTLGALGVASSNISVGREAVINLNLPLAKLPAGRHVGSITLYGQGSALPVGESEIVSLEVGGNVVWSQSFADNVALDGIKIDLPDQLLSAGAGTLLRIVRLDDEKACSKFTPISFTLQNDTTLTLAEGNPDPQRFAAFTVTGGAPVPVLTDLPPGSLAPALPLLAELLGAAGANPLALSVQGTAAAPGVPFILVSHQAGGIVSVAPVPTPNTSVTIPLPNEDGTLNLPEANRSSVLQLVQSGTGTGTVAGLWLSPGAPASLANAALPGDGNLALYDGDTAPATYLTLLHDAQYVPRGTGIIAEIKDNWLNEMFGVFWLGVTVLVVVIFVRRRRAEK
jgi:hypothetical protein